MIYLDFFDMLIQHVHILLCPLLFLNRLLLILEQTSFWLQNALYIIAGPPIQIKVVFGISKTKFNIDHV